MSAKVLVTGANGHLGNNLVRTLQGKGVKVRATVRNIENKVPFAGLGCELVYADLMDYDSLVAAMDGIELIYHTAAVFKHWAQDPMAEIVNPNVEGTKNLFNAAAKCAVKKIIYTSSIVALDYSNTPLSPETWNTNYVNPYNHSKTKSERLAWELSAELGIEMVAALPSAIIGPNCIGHLTPTMSMLKMILENQMNFDVNFTLNYVDVEDVVNGMIAAAEKGLPGQRYILGNENSVNTSRLFEIANRLFPEVKIPTKISKEQLMQVAVSQMRQFDETGQPPAILPYVVDASYGADVRLDISKSKTDLGFNPLAPEKAVEKAYGYLI